MDIITDFSGWKPEQIISYCYQVLGVREMSPEEWEAYCRDQEAKEKEHQAYLKEIYDTRNSPEYPVYKKTCPVCGTVFYTYNKRRVYDDYYKCSRYQHRENAKFKRLLNRRTKCEECGGVFTPDRAGAKYCCAACKQKAYRTRKKIEAQNGHMKQL